MKTLRRLEGDLAAFTLVELLTAVTVTLVLAGLALAVTVNLLGLWRRVQGDLTRAAQVQLAFNSIERDLHSVLPRGDSCPWLAAAVMNSPSALRDEHGWQVDVPPGGALKPATAPSLVAVPLQNPAGSNIAGARFGLGGVWLRVFVLDHSGLPSAVSYQIVRRPISGAVSPANPAPPRYLLFRSATTDTLSRGHDITANFDDVLAAPSLDDVLAENVVDLGVWLYARDDLAPQGLRRIFPVDSDDTANFVAPGVASGGEPEVADVMMRMLDAEGAELVANLERGRGRERSATDLEWWALVEAHSKVYVQRIELKGREP